VFGGASHASGGLATYCCPRGPHRRATVAGLRLVGGAVRPSQDANSHLLCLQAVSTGAISCPLSEVKRTLLFFALHMSANDAVDGSSTGT
jgi:hypothetical protein